MKCLTLWKVLYIIIEIYDIISKVYYWFILNLQFIHLIVLDLY